MHAWLFYIVANGDNICLMEFKQEEMRQHLADCFTNKQLSPFPHTKSRAALMQRPWPGMLHKIDIYCDCDLPEVYDNMIQCDGCDNWFHLRCVGVKSPTLTEKWYCNQCKKHS